MCVLERYIYTFFIIWLECISNHLEEVGSFFLLKLGMVIGSHIDRCECVKNEKIAWRIELNGLSSTKRTLFIKLSGCKITLGLF